MTPLSNEISRLRENDPEFARIFDTFEEIDAVYNETLEVMGKNQRHTSTVWNSSEITISFRCAPSSYGQ